MAKRIISAVLWFFAVAYGWNLLAMLLGVGDAFGLFAGMAVALFVGLDPLHRIWARPAAGVALGAPEPAGF